MIRAGRRGASPTLALYLTRAFVPTLAVAMLFFVLVLEMADLFLNIVQFVQNDVPLGSILKAMALYAPKCASWSLPVATLFAVSYTLGTLYANNELIAVFASGISRASFSAPLLALALALCAGFFAFDDAVVIPTLAAKKALTKSMLKTGEPAGAADVTILGEGKRFVWNVRYFDRKNSAMTGIVLIERGGDGEFVSRLNAQSAAWTGERWRFSGVRRFYWADGSVTDKTYQTWEDESLDEPPSSFVGGGKAIEEMSLSDAAAHLAFLERARLPRSAQAAEYYRRYAFALTPLLVTALSIGIAGMFKKNVLLMSLLVSLLVATLYYVTQMITMLLAKSEAMSPAGGAFAPVAVFFIAAVALARAR